MAARSILKQCPSNFWFAEGCFDSLASAGAKIRKHLEAGDEAGKFDISVVEPGSSSRWTVDGGLALRVIWRAESRITQETTTLRAVVYLFEKEGMQVRSTEEAGFDAISSAFIKDLADALQVDVGGVATQVGGWRILAEAPEGMAWDPTWLSPAEVIFADTPVRWGDPDIGIYSLDHVNSLCLNDENAARKTFRALSRSQGINTVIFAGTEDGEEELRERSISFFDTLADGYDCRRTMVMALHHHSLYQANRVMTKEFKTRLDPGGVIILPHTPHRAISRSSLQLSEEEVLRGGAARALAAYTRIPQNMDPTMFAMLRDLQQGGVFVDPNPPVVRPSVEPAVEPADRSQREKALQDLVDSLRDQVKELQGEVDAKVDPGVVDKLRAELQEQKDLVKSDLMRRAAAAAALRVQELEKVDEERVRELDDMAARNAYLTGKLLEAGKADVVDQETPQESFSSWDDLFAYAEKQFPLVVIGPDVIGHARKLAPYPQSSAWMNKTMQALRTLSNYAEDRERSGEPDQLFNYVRRPEGRSQIAAGLYRADESNVTKKNAVWFSERVFEVPTWVSADGRAFMGEHIVIGGGSHPAPRMHLLDATNIDGKVYVGYVGEHLQNTLS